jgi:4-amino-4-deoxy-L-arabinose transferase-like glycosyltransferase
MTELRLDRGKAFLIVFLTWAAMYLPALGGREFRGEEGRRTLPAVTMVKTGDWLVPHVAGRPYYQKPPLINWLVAASFLLTGEQSERSARLPSAVSVLAFASLLVWFPGAWPRREARLIAAVFFLTTFTVIENGRQIEIEAVYITLTSMAILSWLFLWANARSKWGLWLIPSVFLTCGMLTKGPPILLFYYGPVLGVLAYSRGLRALVSIPHLAALILCLGVPAAWAYFAWRQAAVAGQATADLGGGEIVTRLTSLVLGWSGWWENVVSSFTGLLPWGLFLPLLWRRDFLAHIPPGRLPLLKGARLGMVVPFLAITLIPGNRGRYGLPVLGLMCLLLGWVLAETEVLPDRGRLWRGGVLLGFGVAAGTAAAGLVAVNAGIGPAVVLGIIVSLAVMLWRERARFHTPVHLATLSASLGAVLMLQFPLFAPPLFRRDEICRPVSVQTKSLVPDTETVYIFDPGCQLFLFYIREPMEYLRELEQVNGHVRFLVMREDAYQRFKDGPAIAVRQPKTLYSFAGKKHGFRLLELTAPP